MQANTVGSWTRLLGISLRPWAGHSPVSLLARGAIQVALGVFFFVLMLRFTSGEGIGATAPELEALRGFTIPAAIVLVVIIGLGLFRMAVGAVDLVPRHHITGTVVDLRERRVGDVLPRFAQNMIFMRNEQGIDRRRYRTEVVVDTASGRRQWTVRSRAATRVLRPGAHVRMSVTPLAGHVAHVELIEPGAQWPPQ